MKKILLIIFFIPLFSSAQTTWTNSVANILYTHCTTCHHDGGIAPFSLMTFTEAFQNGADIEDVILSGEMPPWPPDPQYSRYAHERLLTQQERSAILDWVAQGAQSGDTTLAPPAPVYNGPAEIPSPDLISQMPNYTVNTVNDLYRCFVMPSGLASDQYIMEIEAVPGDRSIVHHILIFEDSTSTPAQLDAADPGPGYTNFGGTGSNASKLIGIWVPGQQVSRMPAGMGIKLSANTNIVIQVHYPGGTLGKTDSTQIRFKLTPTPLREISINPPLNHFQLDNGPLFIPANTTRTFNALFIVPFDLSVLAVGPHMHNIGRSITSFGITPSQDTIPFIHIPEWDFHWQGTYSFQRVLRIPAGTTLYSSAFYDNTNANPHNPNNPPQNVALGEATTDEMMLVYFAYTLYQTGDENIIQDSSILLSNDEILYNDIVNTAQLYDPYPNPANESTNIQFLLPERSISNIIIRDLQGKIIWSDQHEGSRHAGYHYLTIPLSNFSRGLYTISLETDQYIKTKKILVE
jgi:hypothetical protein